MSDIAIKASEPIALKAQLNEDWLAVVIGLLVYAAALVSIGGVDLLGWSVTTSVYTDLAKALAPVAKAYAWLGGGGALLATYAALLAVLSAGVATLGADVRIRRRIHRSICDRLCELDRGQLRLHRGGDARRPAEIRHRLVAQADQ